MTLVQIGLPRTGARPPSSSAGHTHEAAEDDHASATEPAADTGLVPASAALALAGGLVVLAPLAAFAERTAVLLLLVGLAGLGLIAALLRPGLTGVDDP